MYVNLEQHVRLTAERDLNDVWEPNARLALDTIAFKPTEGIPTFWFQTMQWSQLDELSGSPPGSYPLHPESVYLQSMLNTGVCYLDQWIPHNPLTLTDQGFGSTVRRGATTGLDDIVLDGIRIDSPEAVAKHMQEHLFAGWRHEIEALDADPDGHVQRLIREETETQNLFGRNMVKGPYDSFFRFPALQYNLYGYSNYFAAYAEYPEVIEAGFRLEADLGERVNRLSARAIIEGGLPRMVRLDHDMADSRGTLVDVSSLDRLWFPHFGRCIQPFHDAAIKLVWHCDGNLMTMVPRLLEVGIGGFQGFQYEDGMDYPAICRLRDWNGESLLIVAGVSVTRTLPFGTPDDVRRELRWLVDHGPKIGLFLGCSSSITPGVPIANLRALIEGLEYYRMRGRSSG